MIGSERRDFHSMPSSMKVTHTAYVRSTQIFYKCVFLFISICAFVYFSPCLHFFHHLGFFLPSLHLYIPHLLALCSISRLQFLFRGRGSWERPCYHCWDSHSFLFSLLSSTFLPLSSTFLLLFFQSKPTFYFCMFVFFYSVFSPPSILPSFLKTYRRVRIIRSNTKLPK